MTPLSKQSLYKKKETDWDKFQPNSSAHNQLNIPLVKNGFVTPCKAKKKHIRGLESPETSLESELRLGRSSEMNSKLKNVNLKQKQVLNCAQTAVKVKNNLN
jgi:hypothetical protein